MDHKGELGHVPEGGGGNIEQDTAGGTISVAYKEYPTKSGHFTFDTVGFSIINWRPTEAPVSESSRDPVHEQS